jgi:hypothetical protein
VTGGVVEAYADLARRVWTRPARLGRTRLVAIDGPSGAGKSVFAARLATAFAELPDAGSTGAELPAAGRATVELAGAGPPNAESSGAEPTGAELPTVDRRPPVLHTDDLLDGWDDQFTFWPRLERSVLAPLRAGLPGSYHRYSWVRRSFLPRPVPVPAAAVVIIEGVSAARAVIRPELSLAVFVTAPEELRLARAVARDGPAILPELRRWHAGERLHFAADDTVAHADLVVDGAPTVPHDVDRDYVRRKGGLPFRS